MKRIQKISPLIFILALTVLATACCPAIPGASGLLTVADAKLRIVSVTTQDAPEGKAWLGVKAEIETSDLDSVRGWKVWVVDENGRESALDTVDITDYAAEEQADTVVWFFFVDKTSRAFTLNFPSGEEIQLAHWLGSADD
ncbi:MAG: hypothetical protein JW918_02025 [Anaerolineae bacterium]|nr:hypothetical protein [Anaerolineae bacterium]